MRLSLGSVGALTAGLLIAFAFWPDNRAVRGPEQIVAQEKPKAERLKVEPAYSGKAPAKGNRQRNNMSAPHNPAAEPTVGVQFVPVEHPLSSDLARQTKAEARITEALNQAVDFVIEPQPLKDSLDFIAARYQIPILTDLKALEDANVDLTAEVRLNTPGVSLRDALQLLLGQMSAPLGYDVVHGVMMISTVEKINEHLETIVYDCRDLVKLPALQATTGGDRERADEGSPATPPTGGGALGSTHPNAKNAAAERKRDRGAPKPPFIQMVISATGTEFWDEGTSASELGGLLIVRQNPRVHERIKALLASIRLMKKDGAFAGLAGKTVEESKQEPDHVLNERLGRLEQEMTTVKQHMPVPTWAPSPTK